MSSNVLKLFVVGSTPSATTAIDYAQKLCSEALHDQWRLEVIDVAKQPELAELHLISAVPALLRSGPPKRVVGDFSDLNAVLTALGLEDNRHAQ